MSTPLWVDFRHPSYEEARVRRQFSRDQYTGNALFVSIKEAETGNFNYNRDRLNVENVTGAVRLYDSLRTQGLGTYLKKRAQGESAGAFKERASVTRFPSHMAALVDSYIGGVFAVESKAMRMWGVPLGDPMMPGTTMFSVWRNIDGSGKNWNSALVSDAANLIIDESVWYYAEAPSDNTPVRIHALDPDRVLNWREEDGIIVEALVREDRWEQTSLFEEAVLVTYYLRYHLDGWERWREVGADNKQERNVVLADAGSWAFPFYADVDQKRRRLPIGRVSLPIGRPVGYQMAQDHNMLYNILSDARWNFRVINHPRLRGIVTDEEFINTMEKLQQGFNAMQGDWAYISPDHENGTAAYKMYAEETRQFYITNHQRMNTPNIERSATEIVYNEAAGRTAFLTLLVGAIDEIENDKLFLASQIEAPERPQEWMNSRVERSRDFKPIDIEHLAMTQSNSLAALANIFPAEIAAKIAKEGLTAENMMSLTNVRTDTIPDEEM